ncbi:MAG: hypothetical protein ACLS6O_00910 [Bifidobacterium sp.]
MDARNLAGEDFVSKTLEETIGTLGVVTRPKVVDFSARLKERRKANARVVAMRACVSAAVIVVAGALVWLFSSHRYSVSGPAILALSAPTNG